MKKIFILILALGSFSIFAMGANIEKPVVVKEEFSRTSWGMLYSHFGELYIQRSKWCTMSDGREGKCSMGAICRIEFANDLEQCRADEVPSRVMKYFNDKTTKFNKDPNELFKFIWNY